MPVEALQGLHVTGKETRSLPEADGDLRRDLVWTMEFLNPATREALTLWVTSLTSLSRGWMDLAPTAPTRWDTFPYRIVTPPDTFLYVAPHIPGYNGTQPKGGRDVFSFVYAMRLTGNGPTFVLSPEVYGRTYPLSALLCRGEPDDMLRALYGAMHQDYERILEGQMPSQDAVMNFLWKKILSFQWGP